MNPLITTITNQHRHAEPAAPNPLDHYAQLVPVRTAADVERLTAEAAADDHRVIAATNLVMKGGQIAGYLSLNTIPTCHVWLHTGRLKARDSVSLVNTIENLYRASGARVLCFPVGDQSPFLPVCQAFGYTNLLKTNLCVKKL